MPEIRYMRNFDKIENGGNELEPTPYEVSDEELAEEAERKTMAKAEELIDNISSLGDAKLFLKRLVRRLIKNGALP